MKVFLTELQQYRGKRSADCATQGNSCDSLAPSERRDLRDVGAVYGRTFAYPRCFNTWETREIRFFGDERASVSLKETFEVSK